uniref:Uncharacterized protein n=1 Tax=Panagrolaimus sp. PS1159 TaxID=55785 RepID=A0AC35F9C2_9BILA
MNLKYLLLCLKNDGRNFDEKMTEVLEFVVGIPHLRIQYIGECLNPNEFEIMLVQWVLRNGYIKSLVCTANDSFFMARYICQTSPKLFIFDDAEKIINVE